MIANVIPILFKALLPEAALNSDIQNELYSSPEVFDNIFDDLTEENAEHMWEYPADLVKEGSDLEESILECTYLHIAIQLQRVDIVEKLLAWEVDIQKPLVRKGNIFPRQLDYEAILVGDYQGPFNAGTPFILVDQITGNAEIIMQPLLLVTPLMLANQIGNIEIITRLKQTEEKGQKKYVEPDEKGYETDTEIKNAQKPQRYKNRLVIGDGNFSYSRALAEKQRQKGYEQFPTALTVTEYNSQNDLSSTYSSPETKTEFKNFNANLAALQEMGAELFSGVDATRVHELFSEKRYRRIHFNFPYYNDDTSSAAQKKERTKELVGKFFESAAKIQQPGDRIHMALATNFTNQYGKSDPVWYESATYGVGKFCEQHGYVYIKKREFIDNKTRRYPGYFHVKTASNAAVSTAEDGREFIFEKRIPGKDYEGSSQKKRTSRGVQETVLRSMMTDSDSSSYVEHSDEEKKADQNTLRFQTPESAKKAAQYTDSELLAKSGEFKKSNKVKSSLDPSSDSEDSFTRAVTK